MQKGKTYREIDLAEIVSNPLNPRKNFEGPRFEELINSIIAKGVVEPILVRPLHGESGNGTYEIVAGERRHRASIAAKTKTIPCLVQEMSDDVAFEIMTIENLQRQDLTPLEQARSFKAYLERKGPEVLGELSQRTGVRSTYITRCVRVLSLPDKALKAWEAGKMSFGHLEQLIRLTDENEICTYVKEILNYGMSVERLRSMINEKAIELTCAKFDKKAEGCCECHQNSLLQRDLFGDESIKKKAHCLNSACFKTKQITWFLANWPTYAKQVKTKGFRFRNDMSWNAYESFHKGYKNPGKQCLECAHFVSLIDLRGRFETDQACVGDKNCFKQTTAPPSKKKEKAKQEKAGVRVAWHGEYFREAFYKTALPAKLKAMPYDDDKSRRILLFSLLDVSHEAREAFGKKYGLGKEYYSIADAKLWKHISGMGDASLQAALHEAAITISMTSAFGAANRRDIADHVGIDLGKEWRITEEYLGKKTIKEMIAMGDKLKIFKDAKAREYLQKLGKKWFDNCNKKELVNVFLHSGADLAGKVPDEILK